jgi:hypothetical protein
LKEKAPARRGFFDDARASNGVSREVLKNNPETGFPYGFLLSLEKIGWIVWR